MHKISILNGLMTIEKGKIFKALVKNIEYSFKLGKVVNNFLNKYKNVSTKKKRLINLILE